MFETLYRWIFVPRNPRRTTKWTVPHETGFFTYTIWERKAHDFRWSVSRDGWSNPTYAEGQATSFGHAQWDAEDAVRELQALAGGLTTKVDVTALRSEVEVCSRAPEDNP